MNHIIGLTNVKSCKMGIVVILSYVQSPNLDPLWVGAYPASKCGTLGNKLGCQRLTCENVCTTKWMNIFFHT